MAELLVIKSGNGCKGKTADIEEQIIAEIESNNYHTLQQIADMAEEKLHVRIEEIVHYTKRCVTITTR